MQTHEKIEVIVVDDGSTVPVKIPGEFQDEVRLIRLNTNQGKMRAQAEGIYKAGAATGFVLTVDSDTILGRRAVEKLLEQFDFDGTNPSGVAYSSQHRSMGSSTGTSHST
jgi:GT2 family glycosyltransferase